MMTLLAAAATLALATGEHRVAIDGVEIVYHVFGKGPVILAHPGGPGAKWDIVRMPLVEKFATVVYVEPVGTGASGRLADPGGYTIARYVGDVEGVRAALGVASFVLLGHSHGGFVAQAYALAHQDRLRGLILYDTTPTTGPEWQKDVEANLAWFEGEPWFPDAKQALAEETSATTDDQMTAVFLRELPLYFADWTHRSKEFLAYAASIRFSVAPSKAVTDPSSPNQVGVAPVFEVRNRLRSITVPTLVLSGTKDFVCSEKFGRVLHAGIPESRLVLLSHSGHMGHVEEAKRFAGTIHEFMDEIARGRR